MPIFNDGEFLSSVRSKINNAITAIESYLSFSSVRVAGQGDIQATQASDAVYFAAGDNVTITTNPSTKTITISAADSAGTPPRFEFVQPSPQITWVVNHNLGFYPTVHIYSIGRVEVEAEYTHNTVNQTTINFNTAQTGIAVFH